jgi:hypothetical protein
MPDIISGILIKLVGSMAATGLKGAYQKLTAMPAFKQAIEETKKAFPHLELEPALSKWCESNRSKRLFLP